MRWRVKVVLLAARPTPPGLSATLPLNLVAKVLALNVRWSAGVVTEAVAGAVLSRVKLTAAPVKVLPSLSVAVACTVYVPSPWEAQLGKVALLVQVAAVLPLVALLVAVRLKAAACQAETVQYM